MFQFFENWQNNHIIKQSTITPAQWSDAFAALPLLKGLSSDEMQRLQELAILFCHNKVFEGVRGFEITPPMQLLVALQACLPILELGLDWYDGWTTLIIYPSGFAPKRMIRDEYGIEHFVQSSLGGEAWHRGPVVLAWDEVEYAGVIDGRNLVIHEFAHKLDMQNDAVNGFPPLHAGMDINAWSQAFSRGFDDFQHRCSLGENIGIDCYGATLPSEFFAVLSEVFFEKPGIIHRYYSDIYDLMVEFYRQDTMARLEPWS